MSDKKRKIRPRSSYGTACAVCKMDHKACDGTRPCGRCVFLSCEASCSDVVPKKAGRPRKIHKHSIKNKANSNSNKKKKKAQNQGEGSEPTPEAEEEEEVLPSTDSTEEPGTPSERKTRQHESHTHDTDDNYDNKESAAANNEEEEPIGKGDTRQQSDSLQQQGRQHGYNLRVSSRAQYSAYEEDWEDGSFLEDNEEEGRAQSAAVKKKARIINQKKKKKQTKRKKNVKRERREKQTTKAIFSKAERTEGREETRQLPIMGDVTASDLLTTVRKLYGEDNGFFRRSSWEGHYQQTLCDELIYKEESSVDNFVGTCLSDCYPPPSSSSPSPQSLSETPNPPSSPSLLGYQQEPTPFMGHPPSRLLYQFAAPQQQQQQQFFYPDYNHHNNHNLMVMPQLFTAVGESGYFPCYEEA